MRTKENNIKIPVLPFKKVSAYFEENITMKNAKGYSGYLEAPEGI